MDVDAKKIAAAYRELQEELRLEQPSGSDLLFSYQPPTYEDSALHQQIPSSSIISAPVASPVLKEKVVDLLVQQQLQTHQQALSVELSRKIAESDSFLCDNCGEVYATFFCLQCQSNSSKYCDRCADSHKSLKIFKMHKLQPISIDLVQYPGDMTQPYETTYDTGAAVMTTTWEETAAVAWTEPPRYRVFSGGWVEYFTEDGSPYYYNETLDESSWLLPEGAVEIVTEELPVESEGLQQHTSVWADPNYYKDTTVSAMATESSDKISSTNFFAPSNTVSDDDTSEISFDDGAADESVASSLSSGQREVARIASENAAMNQKILTEMITDWNPGNIEMDYRSSIGSTVTFAEQDSVIEFVPTEAISDMQGKEVMVTREATSRSIGELSDRERQILAFKEFSSSLGSAKVKAAPSPSSIVKVSERIEENATTSNNTDIQPPVWSPDPTSKFHNSQFRSQFEMSVDNAITYSCENPRSSIDVIPEEIKVKLQKPKKSVTAAMRASLNNSSGGGSGSIRRLPPRPHSAARASSPAAPVITPEERFTLLAKPAQDKFAAPPKPPRHSDKLVPALPCDDIFRNQSQDIDGLGSFRLLPQNCDRLRLSIDVEISEEIMNDVRASKLSISHECTDFVLCGDRQFSSRQSVVESNKDTNVSTKYIKLVKKDEAKTRLFPKFFREYKSISELTMQRFINTFSIGTLCIVYDSQMQVLGTYNYKLNTFLPGLTMGPSHLRKYHPRDFENRFGGNVFEIDFTVLPVNAFIVVPILFDEAILQRPETADEILYSPEIKYRCGLYQRQTIDVRKYDPQIILKSESLCDGVNQSGNSDLFLNLHTMNILNRLKRVANSERPHHDGSDDEDEDTEHRQKPCIRKMWFEADVFRFSRGSKTFKSEFDEQRDVSKFDSTTSSRAVVTKHGSYVPFICFKSFPGNWGIRYCDYTIQPPTDSRYFLEDVSDLLVKAKIFPYHLLHVEHCHRCEVHAMTTRHIPGCYEQRYREMVEFLRPRLPMTIFYSNLSTISPKPRLGAFEVSIRRYGSEKTQLLYSKLSKTKFPIEKELVAQISTLVLPEKVKFPSSVPVEIQVYDSYSQLPINGATVRLLHLSMNYYANEVQPCTSELKSVTVFPETTDTSFDKENTTGKKVDLGNPPRYRRPNNNTASAIIRSTSIEDFKLRQSEAYARVCAWGRGQVEKWFREYGTSESAIFNAVEDGVVDGIALLKLLNPAKLDQWEVHSLIVKRKLLKAHADLTKDIEPMAATYCSPVVQPQAATEEDFSERNHVTFDNVWEGITKTNGLAIGAATISGMYMIEIETNRHVSRLSHAINISGEGRLAYIASMKPRLGIVYIEVKLSSNPDKRNLVQYASEYFLLSIVSIETGKRHTVAAEFSVREEYSTESSADRSPFNKTVERIHRRSTMGVGNIGTFLSREGEGKIPLQTSGKFVPKELPTYGDATMYVPLGKYYSEVDGSVFEVVNDEWSLSSEPLVLKYTEHFALKCHSRIVNASTNVFKKMYRRFKKDFLARNYGAMMLIRRQTFKALARARERIRVKKATKIQSIFRMAAVYNEYKIMRRGFITLQIKFKGRKFMRLRHELKLNKRVSQFQAVIRAAKKRDEIKNIRHKGNIVSKATIKIVSKMKQRRIRSAIRIQCLLRVYLARKLVAKLFAEKKAKQRITPLAQIMQARSAARKAALVERQREEKESIHMTKEELYMKKFTRLEDKIKKERLEEEKRRVQEMLRQTKMKQHAAEAARRKGITLIQRQLRRFTAMAQFRKMRMGFLILQAVARLRIRRNNRKRREARKRQEEKETERKKSSKSKTAPLELNTYSRFVPGVVRNLFIRTNEGSNEDSSTSNILVGVLHRRAVKIQAIYRMYRTRRVYIAKRLALGMGPPGQTKRPRNKEIPKTKKLTKPQKKKESSISLNPFKLVKSIRKLVQDRRALRERKSVIVIQALARGYLCRYRMYRGLIEDVNCPVDNDNPVEEISTRFRPNLSIVTDPVEVKNRENPRRQKQKPPPSPAQKFMKELTKVSNAASTQLVENAIIGASSIKEAALLAQSVTKDYIHKQQLLREMQDRRKRGIVAIQDAMLRINFKVQAAETKAPKVIGHQCYFCVYPFSGLEARSNPDAQYDVDNDYFLNPTKKVVSHARIHDEATRSPLFNAFDPEMFESLDLFSHLSDCGRYEGFEIILYMSSVQGSVLTDEQVQETSLKNMLGVVDLSRLKNDGHEMFFTAFFGRCSLKGGAAFPPAGGRKIVRMKPCLPELIGRPFTAPLSACLGMELIFTLMPIAIPSSHYLSQFRHPKRCDPCYPSILVNGTQLEAGSARWDVFNSAAICASYYKSYANSSLGTMLVSARNKTSPTGLFEFNCEGDFIKSVSSPSQDIGTVLHIICGHRHIACCGNRGNIMYIHEKVPTEIKVDYVPTEIEWMTPIVVPTHYAAITSGCVTSHAGVDIFFTSDKSGNIAVTFLSDLAVVGNCSNVALSKEPVVSLNTIDQTLYVFLSDGVLIAVDISAILEGSVGAASELKRYIMFEEQIFHWSSGIHSSCICHSSAFHNIHNADDAKRVTRKEEANKRLAQGDRKVEDDIMEGHILLVGGGDKDPRVFVFTSTGKGLQRIGKLEGHRAAVTQICCDAAGRYFFTASATDKSIRIWDALLFRCETVYEDVNIGSMAIGFNCLYISSFKAPFLRIWRVFDGSDQPTVPPTDESEKHLVSGHYDDSYLKHLYSSYIESVRALRWCYSIIKAADTSSLKGLGPPPYLEDGVVNLVARWKKVYDLLGKYPKKPAAAVVSHSTRPATPIASSQGGAKVGGGGGRANFDTHRGTKVVLNSIPETAVPNDSDEDSPEKNARKNKCLHFSDSDSDSDDDTSKLSLQRSTFVKSTSTSRSSLIIPRKEDLRRKEEKKLETDIENERVEAAERRLERFKIRMVRNFVDVSSESSADDDEDDEDDEDVQERTSNDQDSEDASSSEDDDI